MICFVLHNDANIFPLQRLALKHCLSYMMFVVFVQTYSCSRGSRGRDRMVVGFTTTYAISPHHH